MLCKNCGSVINDGADLCYACGTPVREDLQNEALYTLDDTPDTPDPSPEAQTALPTDVPVDNAQKAGAFSRFISFLFALIGLILYGVQRKNGEDAKAVSIANAIMTGFCAKMAVAICYLLVTYIMHR